MDLFYKLLNSLSDIVKEVGYSVSRRMFLQRINEMPNLKKGKGLILNGIPLIEVTGDAKIEIGNNVTLTSRNYNYHINLHSPVKLYADRPGALIKIGDNCRIHGSCIHAYERIEIGDNCLIAANCNIMDSNGHDISFPDIENRINTHGKTKPVMIGDNVWIGANSFILPGVTVGNGSVISANSVVISDIPENVITGGNPAVIIKRMNSEN